MLRWLHAAARLDGLRSPRRSDDQHVLMLKALLLSATLVIAALAAWHHGLPQRVWQDDPTGISIGITALFLIALAHGLFHALRLSRTLNEVDQVERCVGRLATEASAWRLPEGPVAAHVKKLVRKMRNGMEGSFDQSLLLDSFEVELRKGLEFGWFIADLLLSLGLLGTVIGFILMLGPIDALDAADQGAVRGALGAMTGGMAVALYTTLTGLLGGIVLRVLALLLDGAVDEVVRRTTELTEIWVLPALQRECGPRPHTGIRHVQAA